jgi:hypothetical protein
LVELAVFVVLGDAEEGEGVDDEGLFDFVVEGGICSETRRIVYLNKPTLKLIV